MIGRLVAWQDDWRRGVIQGLDGHVYDLLGHYLPKRLKHPARGTWLAFDPADPKAHPLYRRPGARNVRRAGLKDILRFCLRR